jgi:nucleoside-diphosphate-sugar epimerase
MDFLKKKQIRMTAALSFIGSTLARRLVEIGAAVTSVDSAVPEYGGNQFNIAGIKDQSLMRNPDMHDLVEVLVAFCFNFSPFGLISIGHD